MCASIIFLFPGVFDARKEIRLLPCCVVGERERERGLGREREGKKRWGMDGQALGGDGG